jgi:hypothetical protein
MEAQLVGFSRTIAVYDPKKPVVASWSLNHLPVNVSVVFAQANNIIGSRSWMFESFVSALAEVEHGFPWRVGTHVLMSSPDVYQIFVDAGIYPAMALIPEERRITQLTSALIEEANIDTEARPFEPEGNNLLLIEALNGYAARETALNTWSLNGVTEYHYLTRAFETYAVWRDQNKADAWGKPVDYSLQDRGVI